MKISMTPRVPFALGTEKVQRMLGSFANSISRRPKPSTQISSFILGRVEAENRLIVLSGSSAPLVQDITQHELRRADAYHCRASRRFARIFIASLDLV